jgi:CYTH domain-containing protein
MLEIEKQYKLNGDIPKDKLKSQYYIEQVYSNIASNTSPDVRIRKITDINGKETYFHTVKYIINTKNIREEIEQSITKEQYDRIFEFIDKKPVIKNRYLIDLDNGLIAEVDHFIDTNKIIIEVEFPNEESMNNFNSIKPDWIGDEIKNKQSYSVFVFSKINNELSGIQKLQYYIDIN